jgi:hypothetical protein
MAMVLEGGVNTNTCWRLLHQELAGQSSFSENCWRLKVALYKAGLILSMVRLKMF